MFLLQFHAFTCHICLLHHVYILLQSGDPDVIVLLLLKLLFCCNFGRRVCRDRLSELSDSNCILLRIMSTFIPCIAMACCCTFAYIFSPVYTACARNLFCLYLFNRNSVWGVLYM